MHCTNLLRFMISFSVRLNLFSWVLCYWNKGKHHKRSPIWIKHLKLIQSMVKRC